MAAAPGRPRAARGGVGGFDRPIVDAEARRHLPGIGAPRHGEFGGREGAVVLVRRRGGAGIGRAFSRRSGARGAIFRTAGRQIC